jgi:hypothetical protein
VLWGRSDGWTGSQSPFLASPPDLGMALGHRETHPTSVTTTPQEDCALHGEQSRALELALCAAEGHGWHVPSAGSGHQGVIRFGKESVDAVVVDRNDGGGEGALITAELKRCRPEVPVVLLTTDEDGLANGATEQANVVIARSQVASMLVHALRASLGTH